MTTLLRLETLSGARNFNEQVFLKVRPFLGRRILEVGMGIGIFTEKLLSSGASVVGLDIVSEFLDIARSRFKDEPSVEIHQADVGAGLPPFLAGRTFDTVLCMNVLEHIEDDASTLRNFFSLLEPGGRLVLVVPQYPWLFNGLDSNDGHFRRYRRKALFDLLARAGFEVTLCSCFNLLGILGWFVNGSLLGRRELPAAQMGLYDRLVPVLFRLEALVGSVAGLSLLAVGRRKG